MNETIKSKFIDWAVDFFQLSRGEIEDRMNDPRNSVNRHWCAYNAGAVAQAGLQAKQQRTDQR